MAWLSSRSTFGTRGGSAHGQPVGSLSFALSTECAQWSRPLPALPRSAGGALSSNARDKVASRLTEELTELIRHARKGSSAARKVVAASHRARAGCGGDASSRARRAPGMNPTTATAPGRSRRNRPDSAKEGGVAEVAEVRLGESRGACRGPTSPSHVGTAQPLLR